MSAYKQNDYWLTLKGILQRIELLAHQATWGELNATTIEAASILPVEGLTVTLQTEEDEKVCEECQDASNQDYDIEDVLPDVPIHENCRCWMDIGEGEQTVE